MPGWKVRQLAFLYACSFLQLGSGQACCLTWVIAVIFSDVVPDGGVGAEPGSNGEVAAS